MAAESGRETPTTHVGWTCRITRGLTNEASRDYSGVIDLKNKSGITFHKAQIRGTLKGTAVRPHNHIKDGFRSAKGSHISIAWLGGRRSGKFPRYSCFWISRVRLRSLYDTDPRDLKEIQVVSVDDAAIYAFDQACRTRDYLRSIPPKVIAPEYIEFIGA